MRRTAAGSGLHPAEFVSLVALLMSLVALAIDAMLPALPAIGRDLGVPRPNDTQFVITSLFLGLGLGQMLFGPLSDRIGRKPAIHLGLALFMAGCLVSIFASTFEAMIAGRFLQGIGAAGPRIVTVALVRDQYEGRRMARLMSFAMAVFILVPTVAPALGQGILWLGGWRAIFTTFFATAAIAFAWFALRQPETLPAERRRPFSPGAIARAVVEVLGIRTALGYTIATGFVFAPFVAYLSSAQQIFQDAYGTGALFPLWFGVLALAIGGASLVNGRLVMKHGMRRLSKAAIGSIVLISVVAWAGAFAFAGLPPVLALHGLPACGVSLHRPRVRESQRARDGASRPHRRGGSGGGRVARHLHLGAARCARRPELRRNHLRPGRRVRRLRGWHVCRHAVGRGRRERTERLTRLRCRARLRGLRVAAHDRRRIGTRTRGGQ